MKTSLTKFALDLSKLIKPFQIPNLAPIFNQTRLLNRFNHLNILIIILLLLFLYPASAAKYFISPSGNDNNSGSYATPYFTLNKAWSVVTAGDTIYMRGGTYQYPSYQPLRNKNGTPGNMIKIWNYPGETPIITRTPNGFDNRMILIVSNYIHLKGIEITGIAQYSPETIFPITIESIGGIFENLKVHDNCFGIMMGGVSNNSLILNCDVYRNSDPLSNSKYGAADGISIRGTDANSTNTMRGCRMWWNSDDGVDLYGNAGTIIEENCWAFWNGYIPGTFTTAGNGMGFKYGPIYGSTNSIRRISKNLLAFENRLDGFDQGADGTDFPTEVYNCTAYKNGSGIGGTGFGFNGVSTPINIIRNNISYANGTINNINANTIQDHNTWNGGVNINDADFISVSSAGMDGARQADNSLPVLPFLRLATNSDLINRGVNVGLPFSGDSPDLGAFESSIGSVNQPPTIQNQSFQLNKNSTNGTVVGVVQTSDPDIGQVITYSILSGNTNSAFAIDAATGTLKVSNSTALDLQTNSSFTLVIKVQDNGAGLLSSQASITVSILSTNGCTATGNITYQVWTNIGNSVSVSSLTSNSNYPNNPTSSTLLTSMEGTTNLAENYGARIAGYICAPSTGSYTFWISGDDNCELWLSTNNQQSNTQKIAFHTSFTNAREWNKYATQKSAVINLIQGQSYYIEALLKEAGGGDNLAVGWLRPGQTGLMPSEVIPGSVLSPYIVPINNEPTILNQSFQISENSKNGIAVGTIIATDPNAGQTLSYSILSGNTNGAFTIVASSGELTVANAAALNYEVTPTFALVIKVQDNGTGNLSSQATITISLQDVNEEPVINNQSFSIIENSLNSTNVGTVIASDPDANQTLTYSIVSGNTNGAFAINPSTGVIVVANTTALNFTINPNFSLGIKVTDNGSGNLFKTSIIVVTTLPILNQPPVISNQTFTLNQNSPTGTSVGTVSATDPDAGQRLVYSILSGNTEGTFTINSSTGEILVSNSTTLHIKSSPTFALVVQVQDNGSVILSNQATVTVIMLIANEPPVILNQTKTTLEHQPIGTIVGNISAYDPDSGIPVTYSITSGNIGNGFAINLNSGNITINNPAVVCYEGHPVFNLNVKVQDNEGLSSEAIVTVNVSDINEQPVCNNQVFSISENASAQTILGSVIGTEKDFNQTLTYSILNGNLNNAFAINASNGLIKVNNYSALNYEATKVFNLTVSVQDNGLGNLTAFSDITVNLLDINEPPVIENQALNVVENSAQGTAIGYVVATDPDNGQAINYSIIGGNEGQAFNLNSSTGLLSVADASKLFYGRNPLSTLTIIAKDNGTDSLSAISVVTINIQRDSSEIIQSEVEKNPTANVFNEKDITIYPNPTSDFVHVNLGEIVDKQVSTRIINMNGMEVFSSVTKGEKKVVINMTDEKPGVYVALITVDGQKYSRNFIVQD